MESSSRTPDQDGISHIDPAVAVSGGFRLGKWSILVACILVQIITFGVGVSMLPLLAPAWISEFHSGSSIIQTIPTLVVFIYGFLAPTLGALINRYPLGPFVAMGLVLLAVALFATSQFAHSVPALIVLFAVIVGTAFAFSGPVAGQSIVVLWFPERSGLPLGLVLAGTGVSNMLFPLITARLISMLGWRDMFMYLAGLCLVTALLAFFVIRRPPEMEAERKRGRTDSAAVASENAMPLGAALRSATLWRISLIVLLFHIVISGVFYNMGILGKDRGFTLEQSSYALGLLGGLSIAGKLVYGRLADSCNPKWLIAFALAVMAVACVGFMNFLSFEAFLVSTILMGISSCAILPVMVMLVRYHFNVQEFPRALGITNFFMSVGISGVLVAASTHDWFGSFGPFWGLGLTFLVVAFLIAISIGPRKDHAA